MVPKINSVYGSAGMGEKGIRALEDKIGKTFGIWMDGYVMVDLEAFEKIVDMVGGVYVEVPMNMNYDDPTQDLYIHLQKGWHTPFSFAATVPAMLQPISAAPRCSSLS